MPETSPGMTPKSAAAINLYSSFNPYANAFPVAP